MEPGMTTNELESYYDATMDSPPRPELIQAVEKVSGPRIAIDCGCGAGSDIAYLRQQGFRVHAFDVEPTAIARCKDRFRDDSEVILQQASFSTFEFPPASLLVADASLFFCAENDFDPVWAKISSALLPDGIFVGSFLGPEDSMAQPDYDGAPYWPGVTVLDELRVRDLFLAFTILDFTEYRNSDNAGADGTGTKWHLFSVVAKKR